MGNGRAFWTWNHSLPTAELAGRDSAGNFSNRLGLLDRKIQCKFPRGEAQTKILHSKKLTFLAKVSYPTNPPKQTPNPPNPMKTHPSQSHYWILHTDARYGVVSLVAITTMLRSLTRIESFPRNFLSLIFHGNMCWSHPSNDEILRLQMFLRITWSQAPKLFQKSWMF